MYCYRDEVPLFITQQENLDLELWTADSEENSKRIVDFVVVKCLCLCVNVSFENFTLPFPVLSCTFTILWSNGIYLLIKLQKRAQSLNEGKTLKVTAVGSVSNGLSHSLTKTN